MNVSGTTGSLLKKILVHLFLCSGVLIFQVSFDLAEYTANVDAVGTLRLLDAIKTCGMESTVRFYQVHVTEQVIIVTVFIFTGNNKNISLMSPKSCEISAGSSAGHSSDILGKDDKISHLLCGLKVCI